ncbi:hypothetical protein ABK040_001034 [Willaertia magna]
MIYIEYTTEYQRHVDHSNQSSPSNNNQNLNNKTLNQNLKNKLLLNKGTIDFFKSLLIIFFFLLFIGIVILISELVENFHKKNIIELTIYIKLKSNSLQNNLQNSLQKNNFENNFENNLQKNTLQNDENKNVTFCNEQIKKLNNLITNLDFNQKINYTKIEPIITLYSSIFENKYLDLIFKKLNKTISTFTNDYKNVYNKDYNKDYNNCNVMTSTNLTVSGNYLLWYINKNNCLQKLSDNIVNTTFTYLDIEIKNKLPSWVLNLQKFEKEKKIEMISKYGNANVFSEFDPHFVIAQDDTTPKNLNLALQKLQEEYPILEICNFKIETIGIGVEGEYGLLKEQLQEYYLN